MSTWKPAAVTVIAVTLLTGCGQSADDLFSNLNGTHPTRRSDPGTPGTDLTHPETPPNYADNQRARRPGEMSPRDERRARQKATEIKRALGELRRRGRTSPAEVRAALTPLAAPAPVTVEDLSAARANASEGSSYGVWLRGTACITGTITEDRVSAEVNGPYPETGCMPPAFTH
ncbi:hypothetical protein AB0H82_23805 [Streptomyces sp. NPDC050732]|uniref:hypothetical protein n=1 Tax=Streptomyces sp. NPDC050732 TaxID=3154632 RepID=UPI003430295C